MNYDLLAVNKLIDGDVNSLFNGTLRVDSKDTSDAYIIIDTNSKLSLSGVKYQGSDNTNSIKDYEIYVSKDRENWILAKKGAFNLSSENNYTNLVYFDKEGTTGGDQLWTYDDISYVKIVAVNNKAGISGAEIDLIAPPGDNINLTTNNVGILENDYCYTVNVPDEDGNLSGTKEECMSAGSIVFKGEYRGNPAFNVVTLVNALDESIIYSGEQLLFASLTSEGTVDEIADGTFVFAVTAQEYEKMAGQKIRAILYRVDDALSNDGERVTSTSLSTENLPNLSDLGYIVIED